VDAISRCNTNGNVGRLHAMDSDKEARVEGEPQRLKRETYTVPEAGQVLGRGRSAAHAAARRGDLPVLKVGGRLLVGRKALERLLEGAEAR
jgi:hypothetical protein